MDCLFKKMCNGNKRQSKNSIRKIRRDEITPTANNLAEQRQKKKRRCNIIIHGRKKTWKFYILYDTRSMWKTRV